MPKGAFPVQGNNSNLITWIHLKECIIDQEGLIQRIRLLIGTRILLPNTVPLSSPCDLSLTPPPLLHQLLCWERRVEVLYLGQWYHWWGFMLGLQWTFIEKQGAQFWRGSGAVLGHWSLLLSISGLGRSWALRVAIQPSMSYLADDISHFSWWNHILPDIICVCI